MDCALHLTDVTVRFPGVVACDRASLEARRGEIHAVVGENGAGKSTLMHVAAGLLKPESGALALFGSSCAFSSPADAQAAGIAMVFQSYLLVERLTALDNVILQTPEARGIIPRRALAEQVHETCSRLGIELDLAAPVDRLSAGDRQKVALVRALQRRARILILDEPTAVLTPAEADRLMETMRRLAASGVSLLFVSHKLPEIVAVADRLTVMHKGRTVAAGLSVRDVSAAEVARMMVGAEPASAPSALATLGPLPLAGQGETSRVTNKADLPCCLERSCPPRGGTRPKGPKEAVAGSADPALSLSAICLSGEGAAGLFDITLDVPAGMIVGIAGVSGNGQRELAEVAAGVEMPAAGRVLIHGRDVSGRGAAELRALGVAYLPEDRYREAADADLTVAESCGLKDYRGFVRGPLRLLAPDRFRQHGAAILSQYGVAASGLEARTGSLSGGNLQRLLVGRELGWSPRMVIVHQPTQGLDLSATEFVRRELCERASLGAGILLISSDLDEVLELSDRVHVLYRGRVSPGIEKEAFDRGRIGALMAGAADAQ